MNKRRIKDKNGKLNLTTNYGAITYEPLNNNDKYSGIKIPNTTYIHNQYNTIYSTNI